MAFTYDLTTDVGKIRSLIRDTVVTTKFFDDEELEAFLSIEYDSVRCAAALALETMAANQIMVLKVIQVLDLKMDGAKVTEALLSIAARFRQIAEDDWCGFEIAEQVDNSLSAWTEHQWKLYWKGVV